VLAAQKSSEAKRQELKALDEAIADRKRYLREQEALITEIVEAGNTQLMSLTHDIVVAKSELRSIKTDIRTAAQDKVLLNEDLDQIREELQLTVVRTTFVAVGPAFG
jgi:chromosome segregation ATPase